jgi:hypothetical protein
MIGNRINQITQLTATEAAPVTRYKITTRIPLVISQLSPSPQSLSFRTLPPYPDDVIP